MFRNYLKMSLRNLSRNKVYTAITLIGLSIAIACVTIAYINWDYARSYDAFHRNGKSIFRIISKRSLNRQDVRYGIAPVPLGPALQQDIPGIVRAVRLEWDSSIVRSGDRIFDESILYADEGFLQMFTFPLQGGSADLTKANQLVLSEKYARKYFGSDNPIGQTLTSTYADGRVRELVVSGVLRKFPDNSSIQFDMLASSELLLEVGINRINDWTCWSGALFVQVRDLGVIATIEILLSKYLPVAVAANPKMSLAGYAVEPLAVVAHRSRDTRAESLYPSTHESHVLGMAVMGLLMLLLACFNFINIALAFSDQRAREIGVRKVLGSARSQLIWQFLCENMLLGLVALACGLGLAKIALPAFNELYPFVHLTLRLAGNWNFILFLATILAVTNIGAALYPALVISAQQPVSVLRGHFKTKKVSLAMRALLTLQFALSIIMVIGSIAFARNAEFMGNFDFGIQKTGIISVPMNSGAEFEPLKNELQKIPEVESLSGCQQHVYFGSVARNVRHAGNEKETLVYNIGFNFLETMGIRLKKGRLFAEQMPSDREDAVVISKMLASEMGLGSALNQTLSLEDKTYRIVGVVDDVFVRGQWLPLVPILFRLTKTEDFVWLQARIRPDTKRNALADVRTVWSRLFPDKPFNGFYLPPYFDEALQLSRNIKTNFDVIGFIAIVISCIGFFALVSLNIAARTKELGIRKALGSGNGSLIVLAYRKFFTPFLIAFVLADVGGYFLIKSLLSSIFTYHSTIPAGALFIADILVGILALAAVAARVWKAVTANPVECLRYE